MGQQVKGSRKRTRHYWALPRTTAREIRCKSHIHYCTSLLVMASLLPKLRRKSRVEVSRTPDVSTAIGWKRYRVARLAYFFDFLPSASQATEPAPTADLVRNDALNVSSDTGRVPNQGSSMAVWEDRDAIWALSRRWPDTYKRLHCQSFVSAKKVLSC